MYGWKARIGLMIPSANTIIEPEFNAMKPEGISVHATRLMLRVATVEALERMAEDTERAARLLNLKLSPSAVAGEAGARKLMSLIRTACDLKMWHLQFNIINRDTLIAAQKEPEKFRDLLVRVAGYSAYFVDLTPQLQNEIIQRTEHNF